jgi:UDP-N-acetylglucosamine enolpyruvyl transferase
MIASALIGKKVIINKIDPNSYKSEIDILKKMGVKIKKKEIQLYCKKIISLKK